MKRTFGVIVISSELIVLTLVVFTSVKHFTSTEYTSSDVIFAIVVIGVCLLLLVATTTCLYLHREHWKEHGNTDDNDFKRRMSTDTAKLSHFMKKIDHVYGSDCAICLEEKQSLKKSVVELSCFHSFHKNCIHEFFRRSKTTGCPLCRQLAQPHKSTKAQQSKGHFRKDDSLTTSRV